MRTQTSWLARWAAFGVMVITTASIAASSYSSASSAVPAVTPLGQIQIYNVSLKLVDCTAGTSTCPTRWKDYFKRLGEKAYRPDIINILEVPYTKRDAVIAELAAGTGTATTAWDYVHSDKDAVCPDNNDLLDCGNNMVAFRTSRFQQLSVRRFKRFELNKSVIPNQCEQHLPWSRDVAVTLQEKDSAGTAIPGHVVVSAATHASSKLTPDCLDRYLANVDAELEILRPARPLTVMTGDLNQPPQGSEELTMEERQEQCPAPWYTKWSLPQVTYGLGCSVVFTGQYRDAVRAAKVFDADDICTEWTYDNDDPAADPGFCTPEYTSPKKRIDFIWVRKELSGGAVAEPTIRSAGTDRGYYTNYDWATRYSDHRALEALLEW